MAPGAMSMTMMGGLLRVTLSVEEAYRGVSAKTIEVYTPAHSAACGFAFQQGERYLVYASKTKDEQLIVTLCSATRPAKYAEEDISYLRSIQSLAPTATIMGSVWRYTHDPNFKPKFHPSLMDHYRPPEQDYMAMEPVPGATVLVKAQNGAEHSVTADADGNWRISGLAPGPFTVRPQTDEATFVHPFRSIVDVAPRGCAKVDIRIESNGRISGTLDHPSPASDWVLIKVFAAPVSDPRHPIAERTLGLSESSFELAPLPPGQYILSAYVSVRIEVPPNGHTYGNLGTFYFPGVTGIKGAEPIDVAEGKATTNVKFRIMY
jgi:hypothetical protein